MSGARRKGKKPIQSLPGSKRGSFESGHMSLGVEDQSRGHLHRDILSADFDALFELAKIRENEDRVSLGYRGSVDAEFPAGPMPSGNKDSVGHSHKRSDAYNHSQSVLSSGSFMEQPSIKLPSPNMHRPHSALGNLSPPHIDTSLWTDNKNKEYNLGENESHSSSRPLSLAQIKFHSQSGQATRSYRITSKGIVRQSSGQERNKKEHLSEASSCSISRDPSPEKSKVKCDHRVMLLGENGVGKRALIKEFMMPDYYFNLSIDSGKYLDLLNILYIDMCPCFMFNVVYRLGPVMLILPQVPVFDIPVCVYK